MEESLLIEIRDLLQAQITCLQDQTRYLQYLEKDAVSRAELKGSQMGRIINDPALKKAWDKSQREAARASSSRRQA